MTFSDGSKIMHASIQVLKTLGWAWRWAEWWVDYDSTWEPLLEPGQKESQMTKEQLRIVDSTRESRCQDARRCRLAAFGAALRNRAYDTPDGFNRVALDKALRAVLNTPSLVGYLENYEIDFFVEWLGLTYRSKSRLLGFGDHKIDVSSKSHFCIHIKDQSPKYELGSRRIPGMSQSEGIFELDLEEVDDFMMNALVLLPVKQCRKSPKAAEKERHGRKRYRVDSSKNTRLPILNEQAVDEDTMVYQSPSDSIVIPSSTKKIGRRALSERLQLRQSNCHPAIPTIDDTETALMRPGGIEPSDNVSVVNDPASNEQPPAKRRLCNQLHNKELEVDETQKLPRKENAFKRKRGRPKKRNTHNDITDPLLRHPVRKPEQVILDVVPKSDDKKQDTMMKDGADQDDKVQKQIMEQRLSKFHLVQSRRRMLKRAMQKSSESTSECYDDAMKRVNDSQDCSDESLFIDAFVCKQKDLANHSLGSRCNKGQIKIQELVQSSGQATFVKPTALNLSELPTPIAKNNDYAEDTPQKRGRRFGKKKATIELWSSK